MVPRNRRPDITRFCFPRVSTVTKRLVPKKTKCHRAHFSPPPLPGRNPLNLWRRCAHLRFPNLDTLTHTKLRNDKWNKYLIGKWQKEAVPTWDLHSICEECTQRARSRGSDVCVSKTGCRVLKPFSFESFSSGTIKYVLLFLTSPYRAVLSQFVNMFRSNQKTINFTYFIRNLPRKRGSSSMNKYIYGKLCDWKQYC